MSELLKFILKSVVILILCIVIFIFLSLWRGGDWIRSAGDLIHRLSQEAGAAGDSIYNCRKKTENLCRKVHGNITKVFKKDEPADKGK